jgi:hypothetical protein
MTTTSIPFDSLNSEARGSAETVWWANASMNKAIAVIVERLTPSLSIDVTPI